MSLYFKQLTAYRVLHTPECREINERLGTLWFSPPGALDWFSEGFHFPSQFSDTATAEFADTVKIRLLREEKVLPSAVIKKAVDEIVAEIEQKEERKVGRREKLEIKEQVTDDLLPRALTRSRSTFAIFADGWLLIDAAAPKQAENLLTRLREALGGLEARQCRTYRSPSRMMTDWLVNRKAEGDFELGYAVTLKGNGDVAPLVKIDKKDLSDEDVIRHALNGMTVKEMELVWQDRISFTLTDQFTFKRIRYLDLAEADEEGYDDAYNIERASQVLSAANMTKMLNELIGLCGGLSD